MARGLRSSHSLTLWGCWTEPPAVLQALAQIVGPQKLLEAIGGGVAQDT